MSNDLSRNILTQQYGARIQQGHYSWRDTLPAYPKYFDPDYFDPDRDPVDSYHKLYSQLPTIEVRSVQVDVHPADFKRLVDALEYLHDYRMDAGYTTAGQQMIHKRHPADGYAEHIYKKQWREEEMRRRHPLLQDLWDQYQMTLNLIASGEHKDNE